MTYAVLGFVGIRLASAARLSFSRSGQSAVRDVVRRIGWRHVWPIPLVLAGVLATASALLLIPGLDWGWWTALGGVGNPVTGTTDQTAGTVWEWLVPVVFVVLVIPALPLFALAEERWFRRGAEAWTPFKRVWMTVAFGLIHAAIGIPLGIALALSVGGAYFMSVYLRAYHQTLDQRRAVLESTAAHTMYNAAILSIVLAASILIATGVT
jgi:hypothetical protein